MPQVKDKAIVYDLSLYFGDKKDALYLFSLSGKHDVLLHHHWQQKVMEQIG